jgi:uncharacterized NAD(P)/FAD-binding protein YdhS
MSTAQRVAIIGSGPRGMSILERLAARLVEADNGEPIEIFLIDDGHVGTGRVWSPDQSTSMLMNTIAPEVSAFSGLWDGQEARPGNGPSFAQWWQAHRDDYEQYGGYAPRAYYGEYLLYVLAAVERALPAYATLHKVSARVESLDEMGATQLLHFSNAQVLEVDRTVIVTGHAVNDPKGFEKTLSDFADRTPGVTYMKGDAVSEMDLSFIEPGQHVGIIGLGLTFYDIMSELSLGRGGTFITNDDGSMTYCPSGREPRMFAASRGGIPMPVRGRNQKAFNYEYKPAIFTHERASMIRARGDVHWDRDVLPLIEAEVTLVYAETQLRHQKGESAAQQLRENVIKHQVDSVEGVSTFAHLQGLSYPIAISLYQLADPFRGCTFPSLSAFNETMYSLLVADHKEALHGNYDSPLKAALDVLRNTRSVVRILVDYGGLHPHSHQYEFLNKFSSVTNFLCAGPPSYRSLQLQALIKAGIVTMVGRSVSYEPSEENSCIHMSSPHVQDSTVEVQVVIDGRVPATDITRDRSSFTRSLIESGIFVAWVNEKNDVAFETGGVAVTESPFHPIRADRTVADRLYVLGIPTEHIRWFMQSGSSRPHKWNDLMIDADAIAADIITKGGYSDDKNQHYAIARAL